MNAFLTKELLPWIQAKYHVYQERNHTTIAGFSLGGLALLCDTSKSTYFRKCVVNVWIRTLEKDDYENAIPWIENQISLIDSNATHLNTYIAVGELENEPLLTANRRLYKALEEMKHQNHLRRVSRRT